MLVSKFMEGASALQREKGLRSMRAAAEGLARKTEEVRRLAEAAAAKLRAQEASIEPSAEPSGTFYRTFWNLLKNLLERSIEPSGTLYRRSGTLYRIFSSLL